MSDEYKTLQMCRQNELDASYSFDFDCVCKGRTISRGGSMLTQKQLLQVMDLIQRFCTENSNYILTGQKETNE